MMALYRNPWREMELLRREIDRAFDGAGVTHWPFPFSRASFVPARSARTYPLVNLAEDENSLYVEALAPGLNPESLSVTVTGDQLTIAGEKIAVDDKVKQDQYHRSERGAGRFTRVMELPAPVEEERVSADYKNGILTITMPKAEQAKPKQISVSVG